MAENEKISDQELIEALKAGSDAAFTTIYKKYWYKMFLVANRKLQNREMAEEVIQDIFTRLWKERGNLRILNLDYYLFSAVRYEVVDLIRIHGSRNEYLCYYKSFATFEDHTTENTVAFNDLTRTIDEGLNELPEKSREIFRLNRLEHWPVSKIAEHFHLSEKAVEYHLTKVTKSMRHFLKQATISLALFYEQIF
ncbi:hypothetical protein DYBT9275_04989 [Dyadobacter sp. CECT 9275]|uniref:RNA polymerase sigma-70 factor n=1 Tax=Dyadobacter helix TaxID=2822344 RepID=A0A916JFF2_9BACT|nr:sigma-70 family RNA polymerase sigma factor [Dyadobacter sp. CECT 9275]CAG5011634.1 hypothetical protein DYBT9275_04989 [Dyadobacter sp. CECT 9275]